MKHISFGHGIQVCNMYVGCICMEHKQTIFCDYLVLSRNFVDCIIQLSSVASSHYV